MFLDEDLAAFQKRFRITTTIVNIADVVMARPLMSGFDAAAVIETRPSVKLLDLRNALCIASRY